MIPATRAEFNQHVFQDNFPKEPIVRRLTGGKHVASKAGSLFTGSLREISNPKLRLSAGPTPLRHPFRIMSQSRYCRSNFATESRFHNLFLHFRYHNFPHKSIVTLIRDCWPVSWVNVICFIVIKLLMWCSLRML